MFWFALLIPVVLIPVLVVYGRKAHHLAPRDVSDRVKWVLVTAAKHPDFRWACENMCEISQAQFADFERLIGEADREMPGRQLHFCNSGRLWGGWAGFHPEHENAEHVERDQETYAVALPEWMGELLLAVAVHELFHLIRHRCGGSESRFPYRRVADSRPVWRRIREWVGQTWGRLVEEGRVWRKSFMVTPIGTSVIVFAWLALVVCLIGFAFVPALLAFGPKV